MQEFILFEPSLILSKDARFPGPCGDLAPATRAHCRTTSSVAIGFKIYPRPEDAGFVQQRCRCTPQGRERQLARLPERATDSRNFERSAVFDFSVFQQLDASNFDEASPFQ
jgi:hypothetical protein